VSGDPPARGEGTDEGEGAPTLSDETPSRRPGGRPVEPPSPLAPGQIVAGRYRLERLLGEGGFGLVYEARDQVLGRTVALKALLPRRATSGPAAVKRFLAEARTVARLDHPHIVPVFDAGVVGDTPWMAMRIVQGRTLTQRLREEGPLPPGRAVEYLRQALLALDHAHRKGVVHRDVKPSNLILEAREGGGEHVWLADFGIAQSLTGEATDVSEAGVRGTPFYMAPEQITGRRVDHRADLFAIGCIACELVTGDRCFAGEAFSEVLHKVVHEPPSGIESLPALAGEGYAAVVRRALGKSPEDRYASAEEMLEALASLGEAGTPRGGRFLRSALQRLVRGGVEAPWDGRQVVVARGVAKSYGRGAPALAGLSLEVPVGSIYGLLGGNGAGKTTFLRIVLGLYRQDEGRVSVFGRDPQRHRVAVLSRVGYVPEVPAAYGFLRVSDVLELLRSAYRTWDTAYCYRLLGRFQVPLEARLRSLSRGLQTKASLVWALAPRPELLVLDDPTLGLDVVVLEDFFDTLHEASRREGVTVLISSHNLDDLERVASHVAFLKEGRLALAGSLAEVRARARRVDMRFRDEVPALPPLPSFRALRSSARRLSGVVLDTSSGTLDTLRALGPESMEVGELTLKDVFISLVRDEPS